MIESPLRTAGAITLVHVYQRNIDQCHLLPEMVPISLLC